MEQNQEQQPRIQIYSTSKAEVSPFWREKYEKDAKKYWDVFYKRHQDKFFKDRHYLEKEWGHYFAGLGRKVILEVGCGAGNTIFPLIATYPDIFIHACDFSPRAVNLVKTHKDFRETCVNAFVCDLTMDDLSKQISPSSIDIVSMIFVLSAVSPEKMPLVLKNIKEVIKPNGYVLFRDYATGDLAQERFTCKDQKISENFYVRGDGTRAFYFSDDFLTSLFQENGFHIIEHGVCCKQVENRAQGIVMNRRWVQAVFRLESADSLSSKKSSTLKTDIIDNTLNDSGNGFEVDMSDGLAVEMFGLSPCSNEIIEIQLRDWSFKIKVLSKEYQHTCKSTGLMLWESAQLMASVLAANQDLVAGRRVLELGCGCGGICSMVAARSAELVVATDGDANALDLLTENVASNIHFPSLAKLTTKKLEWGNQDDIEAVKKLNDKGFDVIIGTDVAYVPEAISPLFATARELITSDGNIEEDRPPALILCHVLRRVDEPSILSAASQFGFKLVDRWPTESATSPTQIIISTWFLDHTLKDYIPSTALSILYFQLSIAYAQI